MAAGAAAPGRPLFDPRSNPGYERWVHPAVKRLPEPGGSAEVAFCDGAPLEPGVDGLQHGEVRHQAELVYPRLAAGGRVVPLEALRPAGAAKVEPFVPPSQSPSASYSREQLEEWGYPKYDPKFDDPEWLKEQFRKEREDPNENANFWLDASDPEYWQNVARRPYAKALLRTEAHWNSRKNQWLQQFDTIQEMNDYRHQVAEKLEACPLETQRLLMPIMKYRIVDVYLAQLCRESHMSGLPFEDLVDRADHRATLREFRETIDAEGDAGAEHLWKSFDARNQQVHLDDEAKREKEARLSGATAVSDSEAVADALNFGHKCKKDGLLEWNKGNVEEALVSWRQGTEILWRIKAPHTQKELNKEIDEIHCALLKNQAQAAIKLGHWTEALEAATRALRIDDQDHKAWFRKACALEGLGRVREMQPCLDSIDQIAVGRPDCGRIQKDTAAKREKVQRILEKEEADQKRMLLRGCENSLFSVERDAQAAAPDTLKDVKDRPPRISDKIGFVKVDEQTRKRLTRDGAEDLLKALSEAYLDRGFRKQVKKLAMDVTDQAEFIAYLNKVALEVQKPLLENWGFEGSPVGVQEMKRAVLDHAKVDGAVKKQAEETLAALYGEFYHVCRGASLDPKDRAKPPQRAPGGEEGAEHSDGDGELKLQTFTGEGQDGWFVAPAHWTDRVTKGWRGWDPAQAGEPRKSAATERREAWDALSRAMKGTDPYPLRQAIERAIELKLSSVTIKSAKRRLAGIGSGRWLIGLPGEAQEFPEAAPKAKARAKAGPG